MMNEDLQQLILMNQFKSGFLARVSHEVRSPLSSLISLHQLILNNLCENPEEEREFINQAYQAALKLMTIIDNIVDVSKLEYGTNILEKKEIELKELLREIDHLTHLQVANRSLKLQLNYPDNNIKISSDEKRLRQVLVTLIETAILLMEEGSITLNTNILDKENLEIIINFDCDNTRWNESINLLQEKPENSLKELKKLSNKIEMSPGMKLLLCQTLIESMGGKLLLIGTENNLTTIKIILPV